MSRNREARRVLGARTTLAAVALLLAAGAPARSDDRELLRQSVGNPYLFILLDTSSSMNQRPEDGSTPLGSGDDAESKLRQAKEVLYEVLSEVDDIQFGFATVNQDLLAIGRKHWIYQATEAVPWSSTLAYPVVGKDYLFGFNPKEALPLIDEGSCSGPLALPLAKTEELLAFSPKTGDGGNKTWTVWLKQANKTYRVDTKLASGGTLGDSTLQVNVRVRRVDKCNPAIVFDSDTEADLDFQLVQETVQHSTYVNDYTAVAGSCNGWEPNSDTPVDRFKYPTTVNPSFASNRRFDRGDVLPLEWTRDNKDEILRRLAPNLRLPGETVPDFTVARYFEDHPTGIGLALEDDEAFPLMAGAVSTTDSNTPLGEMIKSFRTWYAGCPTGSCSRFSGWKDVAAANDPDWACRKKYLLVLTDGDETCGGGNSACNGTASLNAQESIRTFVVAFGLQGGGSVLTCMSANGGTGDPIFPQNRQALLDALRAILGRIKEETRSFASAAVPSVQAEVQDKIYLTNFTPINNASVWDGHADAYLKPLALTVQGLPDRNKDCTALGLTSGCHVWDAGLAMLSQAPTLAEVNQEPPQLRLGALGNQRRVFYSQAQTDAVPTPRRLFQPPTTLTEKLDLWAGLGIATPNLADPAAIAAADGEVKSVMRFTLRQKTATITPPSGPPLTLTYVLGDIFHSNPVLVSTPNRFRYYAADLQGDTTTCDAGNPGYRCFLEKHRLRRKMLVLGSNDGQLHLFDAGIFRGSVDADGTVVGEFDNGTGKEILSYIPRTVMPTVKQLSESTAQDWTVDGTVQIDDVFIDPLHAGTPDPREREWRTVILGGLREGGSGYFAVDVTQPDTIDTTGNIPEPINTYVPACWNGGPSVGTPSSDCGTVPFGAVLWNFTDVGDEELAGPGVGHADLGETWSIPNTGRVKLIDPSKPATDPARFIDKYVAIFGGGMDPANSNQSGNWLYMVDIETGKAIYKRELQGSAPSEPAAVDTDQDGYLDTVYIGTTAGYLYKVDIRNPVRLEDVGGGRLKITDISWEPFKVFDTLLPDGRRGPIYFPPSVIFVTQLGRYALAFGTGNRENLWLTDTLPGRFYLILDEGFRRDQFLAGTLPRTEQNYLPITRASSPTVGTDFLLNPITGFSAGWFYRLEPDERVITETFALSGITVFTSYEPRTVVTSGGTGGGGGGNGGGNGGGGGGNNSTPLCARSGDSHIFVLYTVNANPVLKDEFGNLTPDKTVPEFSTNPFVESSATKNEPCRPGSPGCTTLLPVCRDQEAVTNTLKTLFPKACKFANFTQNIQTIQSDTKLVCIAPVPVCVIEKNWREF